MSRRSGLTILACAFVLVLSGCSKPRPSGGGAVGTKADRARKDAEAIALGGVNGGADSQAKAVPGLAVQRNAVWLGGRIALDRDKWRVSFGSGKSNLTEPATKTQGPPGIGSTVPVSMPRPGPTPVLHDRVVSSLPYPTEAEADDDAVAQAAETVGRRLAELDPPVRHTVTVAEVRAEYLRTDTRLVRPPDPEEKELLAQAGLGTNLVYVEYDIEVSPAQVRELRARERLGPVLRVLGGLLAVALAGLLFLRADDPAKTARRTWLALVAVVLAGGGVAAAVLV